MHNSRCLLMLFLLVLVIPCAMQAQASNRIKAANDALTVPFDFMAEGIVIINTQDRTERLEVMIFSSSRQHNYLAIIKSPFFKAGTANLKKGNRSYLYYPAANTFINLEKSEQDNPCLPFLYLHFHLSEAAGWTVLEKQENNLPWSIEYSGPGNSNKSRINYSKYILVDNYRVPLQWQVLKSAPASLNIAVEIKSFTRTELPDFIFTRAYLQLLCGY